MGLFDRFRKKKKEPLLQITGERIDEANGGIFLSLDWNDDFIKYLRQKGYQGTSDEMIMQKYLESLYLDMSNRFKATGKNEFE